MGKRFFLSLSVLILISSALSATGYIFPTKLSENHALDRWHRDKYSMFIHFGLYSHLGGMWNGEPVTRGYSEQIQSFGGIFSDWYARVADEFNPSEWDADAIVYLAKQAGMRTIVFTSKHHDGFCMFETKTTEFNSVEATPCKRDFVKELADACEKGGINFGLYFSLIDWHFPYAYPISSHNADFITSEHHALNIAQVTELVTNYGKISELWFDMGSLQPQQSRDLYDLVKKHQPECMVSGRLGNDFYDFAVMADNVLPDNALQAPWQSAASMFKETWGYRSWQKRGDVALKAAEKLRSLANVVSSGGNYLLNIGPNSEGGIVPFESEVLLRNGAWLNNNGECIYDCEASPFREKFSWGCVTRKHNSLYLILTGDYPQEGKIVLPMSGYKLKNIKGLTLSSGIKNGKLEIVVSRSLYSDPNYIRYLRLDFDKAIEPISSNKSLSGSTVLNRGNAVLDYSYSCFDYYSNYKSVIAHNWNVSKRGVKEIELTYTKDEIGSIVNLELEGNNYEIELLPSSVMSLNTNPIPRRQEWVKLEKGIFDWPLSLPEYLDTTKLEFVKLDDRELNIKSRPFSNYVLKRRVYSSSPGLALLRTISTNGVELVVNGQVLAKYLNPYGVGENEGLFLVELKNGENEVLLRSYNRFEKNVNLAVLRPQENVMYKTIYKLEKPQRGSIAKVRLTRAHILSPHSDGLLHNISIQLK